MGESADGGPGFETFLAELSTRCTGLPGGRVAAEIARALGELVERLGTGRATLLEFSPASAPGRMPRWPGSGPAARSWR
jgi:hypothetical protein